MLPMKPGIGLKTPLMPPAMAAPQLQPLGAVGITQQISRHRE